MDVEVDENEDIPLVATLALRKPQNPVCAANSSPADTQVPGASGGGAVRMQYSASRSDQIVY